jgi:hypothetical protein
MISLVVLALIISLFVGGFGVYFGFYGRLWTGYGPATGIGLAIIILIGVLVLGGG